jgi:outer membrane protein assembly factor BamB/tetratricopeptide (TPR) repeat protein
VVSLIHAGREAKAQFVGQTQIELTDAIRVDEPAPMVRTQLERVRSNIAQRQWDEAIEGLRQLMENHGERMVRLDSRFISLREHAHRELARLPAEGLALYRGRVDPQAQRWYEEGVKEREPALLDRVIDEFFTSSYGDDALLARGEIALERGQYQRARQSFERISMQLRGADPVVPGRPWMLQSVEGDSQSENAVDKPDANADDPGPVLWLAYPDTNLDLAEVRARLILVSLLEGSLDRAAAEMQSFVELHPDAKGRLAGRDGLYHETLTVLLKAAEAWPPARASDSSTMFAGNAARNYIAPGDFSLRSLAWKKPIELSSNPEESVDTLSRLNLSQQGRIGEGKQALMSYYPLIVGDLVVFCDLQRVFVYNLRTGRPAWKQASDGAPGQVYPRDRHSGSAAGSNHTLGVQRFTATVHGSYFFVRLGSQVTSWPETSSDEKRSMLVVLDLSQQGKLIAQIKPENDRWSFEGPPVCDGGQFYIAMRYNDVRPQAHVACYEIVATTGLAGTAYIPRLRWRRMVCAAESPARGSVKEITHNMLTMVDGTVYLNTNLGAVASLSAEDGRINWIATYPRMTDSGSRAHLFRDLNPCVYHRGTLYVAPTDSPQIFALDAMTGLVRWATVPSTSDDVVHLLGVAQGSLIASGSQLWWLDAQTGKVVMTFPPSMEVSQAQPRGRGMLMGDVVVWPTRNQLWVFNQKQSPASDANTLPAMPREPILLAPYDQQLSGGNLVPAGEYTLLATENRLWAFGPREKPE